MERRYVTGEGVDLQAAGVAAGGISREFLPTAAEKGLFFSASTFGLAHDYVVIVPTTLVLVAIGARLYPHLAT